MTRDKPAMEDELPPGYDLKSLKVRRFGPGRNSVGGVTVRLEPDVAEMFPNADAVNEALQFQTKEIQENQPPAPMQPNPSLEQIDESP